MEISETNSSEKQIRTLETKIRDMEALAKGLIEETHDLKSVVMRIYKEAEEAGRNELRRGTVAQGTGSPVLTNQSVFLSESSSSDGSTVVRTKSSRQPDAPAEPAMALIMQSDGTMKMEPRCGDRNQTDSSGGYGPARMPHLSRANRTP
jgi:hypothetical protein